MYMDIRIYVTSYVVFVHDIVYVVYRGYERPDTKLRDFRHILPSFIYDVRKHRCEVMVVVVIVVVRSILFILYYVNTHLYITFGLLLFSFLLRAYQYLSQQRNTKMYIYFNVEKRIESEIGNFQYK